MGMDPQLSPVLSDVTPTSSSDPIPELFDRINTLTTQFHEERGRSKTMQRTLDLILSRLPPLDRTQDSPASSQSERSFSQDFRNKVPLSFSDHRRRESGPGSREDLLKHSEIPVFDGVNIFGWLSLVERYFRIGGFSEGEQLDLVSVKLAGDALGWFNWEFNRQPFASWGQFKERLLLRFGNQRIKGPSQSLFCIKQTGTVTEYVRLFEDLSAQVSGLDDQKLEGIFLNGLKPAMQELVYMMKPQSLPEVVAVALSMEGSTLRQMMQKEDAGFSGNKKPYVMASHSAGAVSHNQWKPTAAATESFKSPDKSLPRPAARPQRHHTNEELDDMRRRSICFKCHGKWSRGHVCANKELQIMTVLNDYVVEVLQDQEGNGISSYITDEEEVIPAGQLMELSYSSYMGLSSPTTTKMTGAINHGKVVMMLDSGATHNFITPSMAKNLQIPTQANGNLHIKLGTGITVKGSGVCRKVSFTVQGWTFTSDFIVLDLGQVDVILGIYWLRTLGDCKVNWDRHELSFQHEGDMVTLLGEPELHLANLSMTTISQNQTEMLGDTLVVQPAKESSSVLLPPVMEALLHKFAPVFAEPTGLPPSRGREHAINLFSRHKCSKCSPISLCACTKRDYGELGQ